MDVDIVNKYKEVLTSWISRILLGLNAEQCYTSSGGVYSAGDIYRNLQYCAFGCCGPALNRYCCPIIGPIVGICIGAIAFIVILIIIIVCCRKYSEKQIRRRAQMKMHIGKAYKKNIYTKDKTCTFPKSPTKRHRWVTIIYCRFSYFKKKAWAASDLLIEKGIT